MSISPNGFTEVSNLEQYRGVKLRNVRVVRIDLLKRLSLHFSISTIDEYRRVLYYIIAGYSSVEDRDTVNAFIKEVYIKDPTFRIKMGKLVYFRDSDLEKLSIFDSLIIDTCKAIEQEREVAIQELPHVKIIAESQLYLYFSISELLLPDKYKNILGLEEVSE